MELILFSPDQTRLPNVREQNDILCLQNVKLSIFKGKYQLMGKFNAKQSAAFKPFNLILFSQHAPPRGMPEQPYHKILAGVPMWDQHGKGGKMLDHMRQLITQPKPIAGGPIIDDGLPSKLLKIEDLALLTVHNPKERVDLIAQVLAIDRRDPSCSILHVWDGTDAPILPKSLSTKPYVMADLSPTFTRQPLPLTGMGPPSEHEEHLDPPQSMGNTRRPLPLTAMGPPSEYEEHQATSVPHCHATPLTGMGPPSEHEEHQVECNLEPHACGTSVPLLKPVTSLKLGTAVGSWIKIHDVSPFLIRVRFSVCPPTRATQLFAPQPGPPNCLPPNPGPPTVCPSTRGPQLFAPQPGAPNCLPLNPGPPTICPPTQAPQLFAPQPGAPNCLPPNPGHPTVCPLTRGPQLFAPQPGAPNCLPPNPAPSNFCPSTRGPQLFAPQPGPPYCLPLNPDPPYCLPLNLGPPTGQLQLVYSSSRSRYGLRDFPPGREEKSLGEYEERKRDRGLWGVHAPPPEALASCCLQSDKEVSTVRQILVASSVGGTGVFRIIARVTDYFPSYQNLSAALVPWADLPPLGELQSNPAYQQPGYTFLLSLLLEDASGQLDARLVGEDAEAFFSFAPRSAEQQLPHLARCLEELARVPDIRLQQPRDRAPVGPTPTAVAVVPGSCWLDCCVRVVHLHGASPSPVYRLVETRLLQGRSPLL
eukprot:gene23300-30537_t